MPQDAPLNSDLLHHGCAIQGHDNSSKLSIQTDSQRANAIDLLDAASPKSARDPCLRSAICTRWAAALEPTSEHYRANFEGPKTLATDHY